MRTLSPILLGSPLLLLACTVPNPNAGESGETEGGSTSEASTTDSESGSSDSSDSSESGLSSESGTDGPMCADEELDCGGECIDPQTDGLHCGECDNDCGDGFSCDVGACVDDRAWGSPMRVDEDQSEDSLVHEVAIAPDGRAYAVWEESDGASVRGWFSTLAAGTNQWSLPVEVDANASGEISDVQVAATSDGDAMVAWLESETGALVYARRWTPSSATWQASDLLDGAPDLNVPRLASDADGNVRAVWLEQNGAATTFHSNVWLGDSESWQTAGDFYAPASNTVDRDSLSFVVDADGFELTWFEADAPSLSSAVHTARHDDGVGWGTPEEVVPLDTDSKGDLRLKGGESAVVAWRHQVGGRHTLGLSFRDEDGDLSEPAFIDLVADGDLDEAQISRAEADRIVAVWEQVHDGRSHIYLAEFDTTSHEWYEPSAIEQNPAGHGYTPQVFRSPAGDLMAYWQNRAEPGATSSELRFRQFRVNQAQWLDEGSLSTGAGVVSRPTLTPTLDGDLLSTWASDPGTNQAIWSARYE